MPHGKGLSERRSAVEIAADLKTIRHLVGVADQQISKARTDLGVARVRLAELARELTADGVKP
jgi:hypothetical protein